MRKYLVIAFLFFQLTCFGYADAPYTPEDLDTLDGIERIQALLDLSDAMTEEQTEEAYNYAQEALKLATEIDDTPLYVEALNNLGYITLFLNDYESSIDYFQKAYAESIKNEDIIGAGFSKNGYGLIWSSLGDYTNALGHFEEALTLFQQVDHLQGEAYSFNNIGTIYETLGGYNQALDYYLKALRLNEEVENQEEIAVTYNNIAAINTKMGNQEDALKYYLRSLDISEALGKRSATADLLNNLGNYFYKFQFPEEALTYFKASLEMSSEIQSKEKMATAYSNMALVYESYQDYDRAFTNYNTALNLYQEVQNGEGIISVQNNLGTLYSKLEEFETALSYHLEALELAKEIQYKDGLKSTLQNIALDYQTLGKYETANYYLILYLELKDALQNDEIVKKFADSQTLYETEKKDAQIEDQQLKIEESRRKAQIMLTIITTITLFLIVIAGLAYMIFKEREKSEQLLLNILPKKVADTLKKKGVAEPESFDNVTVFFSDIVNFTNTASTLEPEYLINELNGIFTLFDNIIEAHHCERIKTIGDAYMAVCGMPQPNSEHAENILKAARDILDALEKRNQHSEIKWQIRIGIHSGKVTGGVVGIKKYIYDVFGDTINTASRMEANSEPMRINVSEKTYEITQQTFSYTSRTLTEVKGKGLYQMYFLNHETMPVLHTDESHF